MLYRSNTWPVKEQDVVRLDRNDVSMVKWMCKVRPENWVQGFPYWGDWGGGPRVKNLLIPSPSAPPPPPPPPTKITLQVNSPPHQIFISPSSPHQKPIPLPH